MQSPQTTFGTLYLVATPIGNLQDITLRAIEILKTSDLILAEDTRHSKILLQKYQIETKTHSLHKFNEQAKSKYCIELLTSGKNLALISDAGTPLISDPGYELVKLCHESNIIVSGIPGPCAVITALTMSGLPCSNFTFNGFLPNKSGQRITIFKKLLNNSNTQIFYESPKRLLKTLDDLKTIFNKDKIISVSKELTKQFEQTITDNIENIIVFFNEHPEKLKGEFVLIISGAEQKLSDDTNPDTEISLDNLINLLLDNNIPLKQSVKIASELTNVNKNTVYQKALEMKEKDEF